ncbi:hypothetical protein [Bradyrhizobium sp. DASA03007]|uniref:hypothetical protein n=1 Tax=unclassified Bradyrhizobium TaxID=2631580 RepID=UPI003F71FA40
MTDQNTQRVTVIPVTTLIAGPIKFVAVRCEDGTEAKHPLTFKMTFGDKVLAEMGEQAARLFSSQVQQTLARVYDDEWTRLPTYAAVEADRRAVAERRQSNEATAPAGWPDHLA